MAVLRHVESAHVPHLRTRTRAQKHGFTSLISRARINAIEWVLRRRRSRASVMSPAIRCSRPPRRALSPETAAQLRARSCADRVAHPTADCRLVRDERAALLRSRSTAAHKCPQLVRAARLYTSLRLLTAPPNDDNDSSICRARQALIDR